MLLKIVNVDRKIDLNKLLYPSFILPLVEMNTITNELFKRWGYCKNLKIRKDNGNIVIAHEEKRCIEYADEILGLWFDIDRYRKDVSKNYQELIEGMIETHGKIGIATSSNDDVEIFSSIFLSRATDFHRNTVRWLRNAFSMFENINRIAYLDNLDSILTSVGNSFQIKQWVAVLRDYLNLRNAIRCEIDIQSIKSRLLRMKFVGPKVTYAYILFILKNTSYAPIDRNFLEFLKRFSVTRPLIGAIPQKRLCMVYTCEHCTYKKVCTLYRVRSAFGHMSGWLQTMAYLHVKTLCNTGGCNICRLRDQCLIVK
ncbi:MAG: hypothetical protein QXJ56_03070 [Ignisphaera sp.]|uniref:Uncharacterized protein n=1 Tax=Ignisphaera aggregans TaxID=334771 RepID=A0A7J3JPF7_9CREN